MTPTGGDAVEVELEGRRLLLTSLDKPIWPDAGFTKGALVEYYLAVAPAILPHLRGRALTLGRFPNGVDERGFAQTECRGRPGWLPVHERKVKTGEVRRHCVVNDVPSLAWVANQVTVELHPFLARADRPDEPCAVVFDLDPGAGASLADCCRVGLVLRERLEALDLRSFPKTSGSVGLHVYVPLERRHGYADTKRFARSVAEGLAEERPREVTTALERERRSGRVLVDWAQNDASRSTVAPYSLRAAERPTVSAPVEWDEVERAAATGRGELLVLEAGDVLERVERRGDLFAPVAALAQTLPDA